MTLRRLMQVGKIALEADANSVVDYCNTHLTFQGDYSNLSKEDKKRLNHSGVNDESISINEIVVEVI